LPCYVTTFKFSNLQVRQPHKELHQLEELQEALRQQLRRPGVAQQNVEVGLSKFSDVGAELLVRVSSASGCCCSLCSLCLLLLLTLLNDAAAACFASPASCN
jgi:hypothetical protein